MLTVDASKAINNETLVTNLLSAFHDLRCHMSFKLHFQFSHLDIFLDEEGERFN